MITYADYAARLKKREAPYNRVVALSIPFWKRWQRAVAPSRVAGGKGVEWWVETGFGGQADFSGSRGETKASRAYQCTVGYGIARLGIDVQWNASLLVADQLMPPEFGNMVDNLVQSAEAGNMHDIACTLIGNGLGARAVITDVSDKANGWVSVGGCYNYPSDYTDDGCALMRELVNVDIGGVEDETLIDGLWIDQIDVVNQKVKLTGAAATLAAKLDAIEQGDYIFHKNSRPAGVTWDDTHFCPEFDVDDYDVAITREPIGLEGMAGNGKSGTASYPPQGLFKWGGSDVDTQAKHQSAVLAAPNATKVDLDEWELAAFEKKMGVLGFNLGMRNSKSNVMVNDKNVRPVIGFISDGVHRRYVADASHSNGFRTVFVTISAAEAVAMGLPTDAIWRSTKYGIVPLEPYEEVPGGKGYLVRPDQMQTDLLTGKFVQWVEEKHLGIFAETVNYNGVDQLSATARGSYGFWINARPRIAVLNRVDEDEPTSS